MFEQHFPNSPHQKNFPSTLALPNKNIDYLQIMIEKII